MKSDVMIETLPVCAPLADWNSVQHSNGKTRVFPILLILIVVVAGVIGLCWQPGLNLQALVWPDEVDSDQLERTLIEESRVAVFDLHVSSRSDYLCFRSLAGEVYRVSLSGSGSEPAQLNLFPGRYCEELQLSPVADRMVVSFLDGTVLLQSLDPSDPRQILLEQDAEVIDTLVFSPDGRLVAGSSCRGLVLVWDVETGRRVTEIRRANDNVSSLAFDAGPGLLVSYESGIERWVIDPSRHSSNRRVLDWKLTGHPSVREMIVTPDGRYLLTASFLGALDVWDLARQEKLWEQKGETSIIRGLAVSGDAKSVYCYSTDQALIEYELLTGTELSFCFDLQLGIGTSAGFAWRNGRMYCSSTDGLIRIWSPADREILETIDTATL